jgi:hypothetical protein
LGRYTGYATDVSIKKNAEYVRSFRQIGWGLDGEKGGYRAKMTVNYVPYRPDTSLTSSPSFPSPSAGDSAFVEKYPNGDVKSTGFYRDGLLHGEYKAYYKNGMLKEQGRYERGEKVGKWYYYNRRGEVESKQTYAP